MRIIVEHSEECRVIADYSTVLKPLVMADKRQRSALAHNDHFLFHVVCLHSGQSLDHEALAQSLSSWSIFLYTFHWADRFNTF